MEIEKVERLVAAYKDFSKSFVETVPQPGTNRYGSYSSQEKALEDFGVAISKELNHV